MPSRMTTPIRIVTGRISAKAKAQLQVIANTLCYVGEQCLIEARNNGNYIDRTGNLRSSIGYAVVMNGQVVQSGHADKVKDGNEGVSNGLSFLQERIRKAKKRGVSLIVTAGMNYAEYVEAKGYVVLSSAELKAPTLVKHLLTQIGFTCR